VQKIFLPPLILCCSFLVSPLVLLRAADPIDWKGDFGTPTSPIEPGWTRISPKGMDGKNASFHWTVAPTEAIDVPQADPLDALSRDGVRFVLGSPIEWEVELPSGTYDLEALLGERGDSFRPAMFIEAGGKRIVSGAYGFIGTPIWTRSRIVHSGGKLSLRIGVDREKAATGALLALRIRTASGDRWQPLTLPSETWRPAIRWIAKERIRMIYGMASQYQYDPAVGHFVETTQSLWKRAAGTGMNAVAAPYSGPMAAYFASAGMRFFHVLNFASGEQYTLRKDKFEKNVLSDGRVDDRPNPLDETAWREQVVKPALEAWHASKAKGTPISGVLIDLEMYGAKHMEVYHSACTFDLKNFSEFCRLRLPELSEPEKIEPGKRYAALVKASKLQDYYGFLEEKLSRITRSVEADIHREAPDLLIGYLQHFDNWFFRGMTRGLGTPEMPVIAFGENTYYGYNGDAPFEVAALARRKANVLYCVGLWPRVMHPEKLWKDALLAGIESAGFWIYGYGDPMAASDPVAELEAALLRANRGINRFLESGKIEDVGEIDHLLKSPFSKKEDLLDLAAIDADAHPTARQPLPDWSKAKIRLDFGLPTSALEPGWTRVTSLDAWAKDGAFGWELPPRMSFDRQENAAKVLGKDHPALALLSDGITSTGKNAFFVKVPPGRYRVSVLLGDLGANEFRTHQNVSANGVSLAKNITTNAEEYRLFSAVVVVDETALLRLDIEGKGAQQDVPIIGVVVEPEPQP